MADWTSLRYAVADVEGNGQQPPDLVELAVLPITDGVLGEPVSWLVKPPRPITYFATSIHGISSMHVASAPAFGDIRIIASSSRQAAATPRLISTGRQPKG